MLSSGIEKSGQCVHAHTHTHTHTCIQREREGEHLQLTLRCILEIRRIFEEHNRGIAVTYRNVSEAKQKETSASTEEERAALKAELKVRVDEYIQHYTEGCRFLSPGQPVLTGRDGTACV